MKNQMHRILCLCFSFLLFLSLPVASRAAIIDAINSGVEQVISSPESTPAVSTVETRIQDKAQLLTAEEQNEVAQRITKFQQNTGMDFVLLTTDTRLKDQSYDDYIMSFYEDGGYGFGEKHSGVVYMINYKEGHHHLTTVGLMTDCITDERSDYALDVSGELLSEGEFAGAVLDMIHMIETFCLQKYPEGISHIETTPEPTPLPTGDVEDPPVVIPSSDSGLSTAASILLFFTSIVSTILSVLTQF